MTIRRHILIIACSLFSCTASRCEEIHTKNIIDQASRCDNAKGNEIRAHAHVSAPRGMLFERDSLKVITEPKTRSYTDKAGPSGCFLGSLDWKTIVVATKSGHKIPTSALTGFEVTSHADCGSGQLTTANHMLKNESIDTTCSVEASSYKESDLQ